MAVKQMVASIVYICRLNSCLSIIHVYATYNANLWPFVKDVYLLAE